ncbi:betaine lipid synthase [Sphaerulina musiva SO2202]|uniref:Betaine lipid synthase n=1 Tax=Sphaerulina musiva (strain SO2202) TaxID=692275 RepID=M3D2K7_SPHMS|nr:betaine lipid synthase [Sphaerulina musiva SO2202]EMF11377.1 betaine lipid synthase [Sphaerulina musiva SO2202]
MASLLSSLNDRLADPKYQLSVASIGGIVFVLAWILLFFTELSTLQKLYNNAGYLAQFVYACFFKPHTGDGTGSQQDALESFYKSQASIYDATRSRLLQGREDMLALVAAQVKHRQGTGQATTKPIWVDIGGGTGWNIENMGQHVDVPNFFHAVYLVDLSTSLCEIARKRFERLGWKNVHVICEDARIFRLADYEAGIEDEKRDFSIGRSAYGDEARDSVGADVLTMSYSLSMIPEFHPAIDSVASLLAPNGIVGVVDFYVQNKVEFASRNYTGGSIDRHCMWISRVFWRTWFELDRVNLESARRDYIEYKFGTILSTNRRCHLLGFRIPYYIFIGCARTTINPLQQMAVVDAAVTESPFIAALDIHAQSLVRKTRRSSSTERRSKSYDTAVVNLAASLPLPAAYYQNNKTRVYYDDTLPKHRQFNEEYIYSFTWEDARVDSRLLKITSDDVILALTSAGDNILSYALERPKRIHAVDLNPAQNHLLELKVAAFRGLDYQNFWKLFGEGKHDDFHKLLVEDLSPHLSSHAFDFWLHAGPSTFDSRGKGLYFTGGSRHALKLISWLGSLLGIRKDMDKLGEAQTLAEQREIWTKRVRKVLLSQLLAYFVVGSERFLWKALGVPGEQRAMIEEDFKLQLDRGDAVKADRSGEKSGTGEPGSVGAVKSGQAIWNYGVQTLDPVANETLLSEDNHYYLLCLLGHYTRRCHPTYLTPKAHVTLSGPGALENIRIHTDELAEVFARMQPEALTIAVLMDSMDWFTPGGPEAPAQCKAVNRALKLGGRVLIRSAGLNPWYMRVFEEYGFSPKRVAARIPPGTCTDRVNMYASTWICTKTVGLPLEDEEVS